MKRSPLKSDPEKTAAFVQRARESSSLGRSEFKAGEPRKRTKQMKRSQPKRDWTQARAKVEREGMCRACGLGQLDALEAAHIVGREHDRPKRCDECGGEAHWLTWDEDGEVNGMLTCTVCEGTGRSKVLLVKPDRIVPLCGVPGGCHRRYDPHTRGLNEEPLDLLPLLTADERRQALEDFGYDAIAYLQRVTGERYVPEKEAASVATQRGSA